MPAAVEVEVPQVVRGRRLLAHVDYEDAFRTRTTTGRTPEQWLRGFLDDAPAWFVYPWLAAGRLGLRARVGPLHAPDHVRGWRVLVDEPHLFAIGLDSARGLSARLIAVTPPGEAIVCTQIQLTTAYARRVWPPVRRGHRVAVPLLLDRTAHRSDANPAAGTAHQ